jgi:hypothetical protein
MDRPARMNKTSIPPTASYVAVLDAVPSHVPAARTFGWCERPGQWRLETRPSPRIRRPPIGRHVVTSTSDPEEGGAEGTTPPCEIVVFRRDYASARRRIHASDPLVATPRPQRWRARDTIVVHRQKLGNFPPDAFKRTLGAGSSLQTLGSS